MWGKCFIISLLFSLSCNIGFLSAQSLDVYTTTLEEGHRAIQQEEADQALEIWSAEARRYPNGISDPRIGVSYIELATELEEKEKYDRAVQMYYWGLSNPVDSLFEEELSDEIKRMEPIVQRDEYKRWRDLLKDKRYRKVGQAVLRFWKWMDPTPDTRYNERLIEHWSRIAYGREHYTRNDATIYDADERAEVYVKYGEPDIQREGLISYNSMQIRNWVRQAFEFQSSGSSMQSFGSDSVSQATARQRMARQRMRIQSQIYKIERRIHFRHSYPSYEVWVYKDQEMSKYSYHPLIFIFGDDGDTGEFGRRRSVEDMMPNSSFRTAGSGQSIPSSFFLQMLYYNDLITIDNYFAQAFQDLESRLYSLRGVESWESRSVRNRNQSKLQMVQMRAPEERSTLNEEIPEISVDVYQYRLLNEKNEPVLATFLLSNPYRAFFYDQVAESGFDHSSYALASAATGINEQHELLFTKRKKGQPLLEIQDFRGNVDNAPPEITYFEIPNQADLTEQKFTIELQHQKKDSTRVGNGLFKEHVRAIGSISNEQEEPISVDNTELQMGDLIVGTRQNQVDTTLPFGFRVQPDATIQQGENLIVHLEVYHLKGEPGTSEPFQIDYVAEEDVGLLKRIFTKQDKVSLSLNFESSGPHFRENLEIDTSPFAPGDYTLELTAREPGTEREVTRSIEFAIEEPPPNPLE